jgi:hypothetical protein
MSSPGPEEQRSRRPLTVLLAVVVAAGGGFIGWLLTGGATRLPPTRPHVVETAAVSDDQLGAARETFLREPSLANSRTYLQQLNEYIQLHPEQLLPEPPKEAFQFPPVLKFGSGQLHMTKEDRDEIASRSFTHADAYYLETCAYMAEAVHTLPLEDLSERDRAQVCFDWVMRQMPLHESAPHFFPRHVLCRGKGSTFSRSFVYLAALERAGISSGVLTCRPANPCVLVCTVSDGNVYLFDAELGVVLPGKRAPASLAQLEADPEWLRSWAEARAGDIDLRKRDIYPTWTAVAASPRMSLLEEQLRPTFPLRLHINVATLQQRWRDAVKGPLVLGSQVWPQAYWQSLLMTARAEDAATPAENEPRPSVAFRDSLVPWEKLPTFIRELETNTDAAMKLRVFFAAPFENFYLKPGGPRDLLVRGRLEEAAHRLVELHDQLQEFQRQAAMTPNVASSVAAWCAALRKAEADARAAQLAARSSTPQAAEAVQKARDQWQLLWSKEHLAPVLQLLHASAAEPLDIEVAYQLALCKHEQAERLQIQLDHQKTADAAAVRAAWRSAAERWSRFLDEHPQAPGEGNARLLGARALEMSGDRAAALLLVQDPSAHLHPWDRRACLYRARLLKETKP